MSMRFITVESPPRVPFGNRVARPEPEPPDSPPEREASQDNRPMDVQIVAFLWSVARLPFRAIARGDRFYEEYARPFLAAMLMGRATRSEAKRRRAICEDCPQRVEVARPWFADFQIGVGMMLWGAPLLWPWWWIGAALFGVGFGLAASSWLRGDGRKASFCKQCNCGTHGMARLDFKVTRAGS